MIDITTKKLTPKQRKAIEALLTTGSVTEAAGRASVSRETIYTWLRQDHFQAALHDATAEAMEGLSRSLVALGDLAANTLKEAMSDTAVAFSSRLRAVEVTFSNLMKLRELIDLERRVSVLERRIQDEKSEIAH